MDRFRKPITNRLKYNEFTDRLFEVSIPVIATYDEEEIRLFGLPAHVDDTGRSISTANDMVLCSVSIKKMLDTYSGGYPVSVVNKDDINEIYRICDEVISKYKNVISPSLNKKPNEDYHDYVLEIDNFIDGVFNQHKLTIAKHILKEEMEGVPGLEIDRLPIQNLNRSSVLDDYNAQAKQHNNNIMNNTTTMIQGNRIMLDPNNLKRSSVKDVVMTRKRPLSRSRYSDLDDF